MNILDKIKQMINPDQIKLPESAETLLKKGEKLGQEGLSSVKEAMGSVTEKAGEIGALAKLKYELSTLKKAVDLEYRQLGSLVVRLLKENSFSENNPAFIDQLERIETLSNQIEDKQRKHDELSKNVSDNYVLKQLSEDLAEADSTIDKVIVSDKSSAAGKLLKELRLPKDALISAIKREGELIIPDGNTQLLSGDQVIVIGKRDDVSKVVKRLETE
jgi:uncharacterized protein with PhoU and TrkA domain